MSKMGHTYVVLVHVDAEGKSVRRIANDGKCLECGEGGWDGEVRKIIAKLTNQPAQASVGAVKPMPQPVPQPAEGWAFPLEASARHYFVDGVSVCRFKHIQQSYYRLAGDDTHRSNCGWCLRWKQERDSNEPADAASRKREYSREKRRKQKMEVGR